MQDYEVIEVKEENNNDLNNGECMAILLIVSAIYVILGALSIVAYCCRLPVLMMILMVGIGGISVTIGLFLFGLVVYILFTDDKLI